MSNSISTDHLVFHAEKLKKGAGNPAVYRDMAEAFRRGDIIEAAIRIGMVINSESGSRLDSLNYIRQMLSNTLVNQVLKKFQSEREAVPWLEELKHTMLPWVIQNANDYCTRYQIESIGWGGRILRVEDISNEPEDNAFFLMRACNSFYGLVNACMLALKLRSLESIILCGDKYSCEERDVFRKEAAGIEDIIRACLFRAGIDLNSRVNPSLQKKLEESSG